MLSLRIYTRACPVCLFLSGAGGRQCQNGWQDVHDWGVVVGAADEGVLLDALSSKSCW